MEQVEGGQQAVVLVGGLGEAESGIDNDVGYSGLTAVGYLEGEVLEHIGSNVVILRKLLHGRGSTAQVHQHVRHLQLGHCGNDVGVECAAAYVVDYVYAEVGHDFAGHVGAERVDRHDGVWAVAPYGLQRRGEAVVFFVGRYGGGAGTSRIAADVQYVGAVVKHTPGYAGGIVARAAGRVETVGRHVDDAHYLRSAQ